MEPQELKSAIHEVLDERDGIDRGKHQDHHHYVERLIDRDKKRSERWEAIRKQVGGWAVIAFLSGAAYTAWIAFQTVIKKIAP